MSTPASCYGLGGVIERVAKKGKFCRNPRLAEADLDLVKKRVALVSPEHVLSYLILHNRPSGIFSSIFPLSPPQYRASPFRHSLPTDSTVYLLPITTTDVAHRGFHIRIRLAALLRRRRRRRRHQQLRIPNQSTPRFSFIISHTHSHIL